MTFIEKVLCIVIPLIVTAIVVLAVQAYYRRLSRKTDIKSRIKYESRMARDSYRGTGRLTNLTSAELWECRGGGIDYRFGKKFSS